MTETEELLAREMNDLIVALNQSTDALVQTKTALANAKKRRERTVEYGKKLQATTDAAVARTRHMESVLADVWRWSNDKDPLIEQLHQVLLRADADYQLVSALNELEMETPGWK